MRQTFSRLTALVTDQPGDRPAMLAEARALWAHIGNLSYSPSGAPTRELVSAVTSDIDVWFGPHHWDEGSAEIALAKADFLADLIEVHAALVSRHH